MRTDSAAFRRAAHQRLVDNPRRGRLLLQLALVADADARAIFDPYAWPPPRFDDLAPEDRAEVERLRALGDALAREAARLGLVGGSDAAFGEVIAAARPIIEAADERDWLAADIAHALERGAVLSAGGCGVVPYRSVTPRPYRTFVVIREATGEVPNEGSMTALGAAGTFVGERGAGVEAAQAALEAWEQELEAAE